MPLFKNDIYFIIVRATQNRKKKTTTTKFLSRHLCSKLKLQIYDLFLDLIILDLFSVSVWICFNWRGGDRLVRKRYKDIKKQTTKILIFSIQ